ncbi:Hypothetical predicted protein [Mytilus galloprovincialis]|uniref:Exostosin GT47 domain-containing protein n=1 Tax=Mytilus galloprovincialis TaxID=29158 RepID=A0A8B6DVM7_MYTGA|nr:Hypothetical predicted protein [Mytilus galloprovincialis]
MWWKTVFEILLVTFSVTMVTGMSDFLRVIYRKSLPADLKAGFKMDFPYKIYVYNLPPALNENIVKEITKTNHVTKGMMTASGLGREIAKMGKYEDMSIRDTFQFSLEVIMHQKMLNSPYRTLDPDAADFFYVPAYTALRCIVKDKDCQSCLFNRFLSALVSFLQQQPYFKEKRPHFSAIGKIHRELADFECPYLLYPVMKELTFFAIEKEAALEPGAGGNLLVHQAAQSLIVMPYPSYIHFTANTASVMGYGSQRTVFALLPVAHPEESTLSTKLSAQFNGSTTYSYGKYFRNYKHGQYDMIHVNTDARDNEIMIRKTISWMTHSTFCLHPPGESSTRRSFYDSILCGCIPVIFIDKAIPYAFPSSLDYSKFSVGIKQIDILQGKNIGDILRSINPNVVKQLQRNLDIISQRMQYSVPKANVPDAIDIALLELAKTIEDTENEKDEKKKLM